MADATSAVVGLVPVALAAGIAMKVTDKALGGSKGGSKGKSKSFGFGKKK